MPDTIVAALLGPLEGLTEFIPVSSTGHVLLAGHFLGFDNPGRAFEVLIQLGAILAVFGVYARKVVQPLPAWAMTRRRGHFLASIIIGFAPGGGDRRSGA